MLLQLPRKVAIQTSDGMAPRIHTIKVKCFGLYVAQSANHIDNAIAESAQPAAPAFANSSCGARHQRHNGNANCRITIAAQSCPSHVRAATYRLFPPVFGATSYQYCETQIKSTASRGEGQISQIVKMRTLHTAFIGSRPPTSHRQRSEGQALKLQDATKANRNRRVPR